MTDKQHANYIDSRGHTRYYSYKDRKQHELLKRIGRLPNNHKVIDPNPPYGLVHLEEIADAVAGKDIVLVANSESLLIKEQGATIDAVEIVVRMNEGFTLPELQEHTGVRCSIWACGLFQEQRILRASTYFNEAEYILRLNAKHYSTTPDYIKPKTFAYPDETAFEELAMRVHSRKGTPSTGISVIDFFANYVKTYKTLYLAGFDFFTTPTWYNSDRYNGPHVGSSERNFVDRIRVSARIKDLF